MAHAKALGQEHAWCESRDTAPGAGVKGVGWACSLGLWRSLGWISGACLLCDGCGEGRDSCCGLWQNPCPDHSGPEKQLQGEEWARRLCPPTPSAVAFARSPMTRREGYSHPPLPSRVLLPLAFPVTPKPRGVSSGSPWFAATRGAPSPSSLWEASWCVTFFCTLAICRVLGQAVYVWLPTQRSLHR